MAEPPTVSEDTPRDGDEGSADDAKSQKSGPKSQAGSKPASRAGSAQSKKSGKSVGGDKKSGPPSPTGSAKDNPAADWRNMRRIIAEDPEWSLATVPLLVEITLKNIIEDFESKFLVFIKYELRNKITLRSYSVIYI